MASGRQMGGVLKNTHGEGPAVKEKSGATNVYHLPMIPVMTWEREFENAVLYLTAALGKRRKVGKKPVVVHSLRVAYRLAETGYGRSVIIAGVLHDLLEKTKIPKSQITRLFGRQVTDLVEAVTNDPRIKDPIKRYEDSVLRCFEVGAEALAVRIADLTDNIDRLLALEELDRYHRLEIKSRILLTASIQLGMKGQDIKGLQYRLRQLLRVRKASL